MSYTIFYNKLFIKANKDGKEVFFPMTLGGDNNTYDTDNKGRSTRRSRDWYNQTFILRGKQYGTLEDILLHAEECRERAKGDSEEYEDAAYGWFTGLAIGNKHTSKTSFTQYKNFYISGCKGAMTVEELREKGISIKIETSVYEDSEIKAAGKSPICLFPKTSEELIAKTDECTEYFKDTKFNIYISITCSEEILKSLKNKGTKEKNSISVDFFFVVKDETNLNFIIKATKNGYQHSGMNLTTAKKFRKETSAKKLANKLNSRVENKERFKVKRIDEKWVFVI